MTEQSASAQLRQTQAALAASQQDLTRALAELATTQDELARAVELAALARAERDTRAGWQVARADYGLTCGECAAPIVRGQAVEPQPGTTHGTWIHVACPTKS